MPSPRWAQPQISPVLDPFPRVRAQLGIREKPEWRAGSSWSTPSLSSSESKATVMTLPGTLILIMHKWRFKNILYLAQDLQSRDRWHLPRSPGLPTGWIVQWSHLGLSYNAQLQSELCHLPATSSLSASVFPPLRWTIERAPLKTDSYSAWHPGSWLFIAKNGC